MEEKVNYQKIQDRLIKDLKKDGKKPSLLLHVCCGPCFTFPYEVIKDYFDITIIYNNSNIYPEEEYYRRLNELKTYLKKVGPEIKIVEFEYDNETYNLDLLPLKDDREGNDRCRLCFKKRLSQGYKYASDNGFEYFGTVMSISRFKNSQDLNKIGYSLQDLYPNVKWLPADFKKGGGYEKSLQMVKDNNMYFQNYCGCKFSIRNKDNNLKNSQ